MVNNNSVDICSSKYFLPIVNNEIVFNTIISDTDRGYEKVKECIIDIMSCSYNEKNGYELRLKLLLMEMFCILFEYRLYTNNSDVTDDIKDSEKIKRVIQYIEDHYTEKITLEDLAEFAGRSVYHFAHNFKKCTGQSPIEYIKQYRVTSAAKMLLSTNQ